MPIVDLPSLAPSSPVNVPRFAVTPGALPLREPLDTFPAEATDLEQRTAKSLGEAVFEQENLIVSAMAAETYGIDRTPDPNVDTWAEIKGSKYEPYFDRFTDAANRPHIDAIKRQIDREKENRDIIDSAPLWQSMPLILGASVLDPTILLPGGAFVRSAKGGLSVLRSALNVGTAAAGAVALQEAGLQATQQTRTLGESAINVSASALLGGLLGAGGSALLTRAEWNRAVRGIEHETRESFAAPIQPELPLAPAGAAAATGPTLEQLTVAGTSAAFVSRLFAWMNPGQRLIWSPNVESRFVSLNLAEFTMHLRGAEEGLPTPQAAESFMKQWDAGLMEATATQTDSFAAYKKSGGKLTKEQFNEQIGVAGFRNDEHVIPEVGAAAKAWRSKVVDPLLKAAQEQGLIPDDVTVETAPSYFSRYPNRRKIIAREHEFKQEVAQYVLESAPRWKEDFEVAAANRLAEAQDKLANAAGDAARETAERALRDLETEIRLEREAKFGDETWTRQRAAEIANEVYDHYTLRGWSGKGRPDQFRVSARGPMLGRTFMMPDERLHTWMHTDANLVWRRYHHMVSTDIELARLDKKLGGDGDPELPAAFKRIREGYDRLRAQTTDEKKLTALRKREKQDIDDIAAIRDVMRGTFDLAAWERNLGKIARHATLVNYIRQMGQVVLASVPEVYRTAMVHGLQPTLGASMSALRGLRGFKMSATQAKKGGNITERVLSHRLVQIADLNNKFAAHGPVENMLGNLAEVASSWNGIRLFTDATKMLSSVVTQDRILRTAKSFSRATKEDRRYMLFVGLDEAKAARIAAKFDEFGEVVDGHYVANTERWVREGAPEADQAADRQIVREYYAAMNKDIDTTIVTRSVADIPVFANTPIGKAAFQFNAFNLASHQRVLLRGMQERSARFLSSLIAMSSLGMMVTYLQALSANRLDSLPDFEENPGWWIAEGLDRSGILMLPMQLSNVFELATGINPVKAPITAFDETAAGSARLRNRNIASVLGPSMGLAEDLRTVATIPGRLIAGEEVTRGQRNAGERLLPFNSYIGMRQMLRWVINADD